MPPQVLNEHPLMKLVGGAIMVPTDVTDTCSSGSGAILDYLVVSPSLRPWISKLAATYVPWKHHRGLTFSVMQPLLPLQTRQLVVPCPMGPCIGSCQEEEPVPR